MINRLLLAIAATLVFAGTIFAQAAASTPPPETTSPSTEDAAPSQPSWIENTFGGGNSNSQFWASGDYLLGWFRGDKLPPLVTTSPPGTPALTAGILGLSTTSTVFGGNTVNDTARSGLQFDMGYWFTPEHWLGVEIGYRLMESQAAIYSTSSKGNPILAQPYIDATTNMPQAALIAFPGISSGTVNDRAASGNFNEAHLDLTENLLNEQGLRFDALWGYRFYSYGEALRNQSTILPTGATVVPGTQFASQDDFNTSNLFNGIDFGLRTQFVAGDFSLGVLTNLALGRVQEEIKITGNSAVTVPGTAPVSQTGGFYALASNIGTYSNRCFAFMPEAGATLGWQATPSLRLTLGYSVLWLNNIALAANQINQTINPNLFPPATRAAVPGDYPQFNLNQSYLWLQTINFGVEFRY